MAFTNPSIADFESRFDRDFPYGSDANTSVRDIDIARAFTAVNIQINPGLFADQASYTEGYLLLSAHFLVQNLRASSQGLNGQFNFLQAGKGVGSVNESFAIPERILKIAAFAMLAKTNYGALYLQMILPQLTGQIVTAHGRTKP